MLRSAKAAHRGGRQRHALVDLAGDAPGGGDVDEHGPVGGQQRGEPLRREGLVAGRALRSAARLAGPARSRPAIDERRRRPARRQPCRAPAAAPTARRSARVERPGGERRQHDADQSRQHRPGPPAGPAPRPARPPWRTSGRPAAASASPSRRRAAAGGRAAAGRAEQRRTAAPGRGRGRGRPRARRRRAAPARSPWRRP